MADEMKRMELNDEELEQVAGGYTADELIVSKAQAQTKGTCPIQAFNDKYWNGNN